MKRSFFPAIILLFQVAFVSSSEESFMLESYEVHFERGVFDAGADYREELSKISESFRSGVGIDKIRLGCISYNKGGRDKPEETLEIFFIANDGGNFDSSYIFRSALFVRTKETASVEGGKPDWQMEFERESKISEALLKSISACLLDAIHHAEFESPAGYFHTNTTHFYINELSETGPKNVWMRNPARMSRAWFLKEVFNKKFKYGNMSAAASSEEYEKLFKDSVNDYWRSPKVLRDPNVTIESIRKLDPFRVED